MRGSLVVGVDGFDASLWPSESVGMVCAAERALVAPFVRLGPTDHEWHVEVRGGDAVWNATASEVTHGHVEVKASSRR